MTEATAPAITPPIEIRSLERAEEMSVGVVLQMKFWGYSVLDTVPEQMFVVAKESGGQVLVAYDGETPLGFALAYAGYEHGRAYLHSHMVGVVPGNQDKGIGRLLKLAQRDDAIARGIDLIAWTFDPLQVKNAYFNLARLGAIVRKYLPNFYGLTSSPLHAGLPTDRLVAEWWVRSPRVESILNGAALPPRSDAGRVRIPANIRTICADTPAEAEAIQKSAREQFQAAFASGRAAVGFELDQAFGSYILEPYED